jgi:hypothetical protein
MSTLLSMHKRDIRRLGRDQFGMGSLLMVIIIILLIQNYEIICFRPVPFTAQKPEALLMRTRLISSKIIAKRKVQVRWAVKLSEFGRCFMRRLPRLKDPKISQKISQLKITWQ